ncbi:MAG: hypothetical protein ACFCUS_05435 [Rubrimonas sp.]|uniref:hypothetical protein n=1 Tax=Rubrimonas sp. TaxID=2036015 RepID=UPI002FDC99D1
MRALVILAALAALGGCAGVRPGTPPMAGPAELQQRPGLLSGPSGEFLLIGSDPETPAAP